MQNPLVNFMMNLSCWGPRNVPSAEIPGLHKGNIPGELAELRRIIGNFTRPHSQLEKRYGQDLLQSLKALEIAKLSSVEEYPPLSLPSIRSQIKYARYEVKRRFPQLSIAIGQDEPQAKWLKASLLWPPIITITLLKQLQSTFKISIPLHVKGDLIEFALSITILQRLLRIEDSFAQNDNPRLLEERRNSGHEN
jgi:hypothetical protein